MINFKVKRISSLTTHDKETMIECVRLGRKLRDEPYESREEFHEDLNTLCDKLLYLRTQCVDDTYNETENTL